MVNCGDYLFGSYSNGFFKISNREQSIEAINYLEHRIPVLHERADRIRVTWNENNPDNLV